MTDAFDAITVQRAAFLASGGGRVCLGNAAGDLDSVVSALAAAALYGGAALARFPRRTSRCAATPRPRSRTTTRPRPRKRAQQRRCLRRPGGGSAGAACEVVLTDHNAFDGGDASLAFASPATVVAVVDHHARGRR
ncbi:pyrophosphatase [Aureococcus anophagefferens]|nr:pyrophosphatase [Aureococcus anophagefferens]